MQLTELLYQRVKELGVQGSLSLRPGYVALVSKSRAVRPTLVAALFPGPEDQRLLADGSGPCRIGVGLLGKDGQSYRLLRELGGGRQLHKFDVAQKKYVPLTEDDLEISSFLRVECGMPTPDSFGGFFILDAAELPSARTVAAAPAPAAVAVDAVKVKALQAELELTRSFEAAQDRLFKVQQRLQELNESRGKLDIAERDVHELEAQLTRSVFTPAQMKDLTARAGRYLADKQRFSDAQADVAKQRQRIYDDVPESPESLEKNPLLWGGVAGGLALDALAFLLKSPWVALLGLVPYGVALGAALKWIEQHEGEGRVAGTLKRLKDREDMLKKTHTEEQAPLRAALKTASLERPEDLVELFKQRDELLRLRDTAKARMDSVRAEPGLSEEADERPKLIEEKQILEMTVATQGFARSAGEIEIELKRELGLSAPVPKKGGQGPADADMPRLLGEKAAEVLGAPAAELWTAVAPRLTAYLTALTDKRIVAGKLDAKGALVLSAPDGRGGPYQGLPLPLRDLAWIALRLTFLERVAQVKKMPVMVDDSFAGLEPPKRALLAKMLKGLAGQTQVIHRTVEAPPPGLADHVVQVP